MKNVAVPIRTSPVYDVSDDDVAPVQAPDHLVLPPDLPLITPDLLNVKKCTRQQELYHRICMEVQDVDAQPLRYGRLQYPGAVPVHRPDVNYVTLISNRGRYYKSEEVRLRHKPEQDS